MKPFAFFIVLFIFLSAFSVREISKGEFYKVFSAKSEAGIDAMIEKLEHEKPSSLLYAYQGALYMKKADFVKGVNEKVRTFKKGARLLEDEITKKPSNTEYRFLRLTVQEHAPKILKYNKDLNADKKAIETGYKNLSPELKEIIKEYTSGSKLLKIDDLQ
jgi:hypothetical protein